jgi:hypothetical protein
MPAASVSGLYFAHPKANYFSLGKIQKDQVWLLVTFSDSKFELQLVISIITLVFVLFCLLDQAHNILLCVKLAKIIVQPN